MSVENSEFSASPSVPGTAAIEAACVYTSSSRCVAAPRQLGTRVRSTQTARAGSEKISARWSSVLARQLRRPCPLKVAAKTKRIYFGYRSLRMASGVVVGFASPEKTSQKRRSICEVSQPFLHGHYSRTPKQHAEIWNCFITLQTSFISQEHDTMP